MAPTQIGRYQILEELGRGAMGVVYRAFDPNIGRPVAVKTVLLDRDDPEAVKRFQREAQAAGILSHPNIVTIYDAGENNGVFYITMELVEGETLQRLLGRGPLSLDRAISILEQVSAAPLPSPPAEPRSAPPPAASPSILPGRVVVHTSPQGARVFVNGDPTPYRSPVNFALPPGRHQITVERSGFAPETREVVVETNQMVQLRFDLSPEGGGGGRGRIRRLLPLPRR